MIVAFLQNSYAATEKDAQRWEQFYREGSPDKTQLTRRWALCGGSENHTYRRLRNIFGTEVCKLIWWENASPRWGWKSTDSFPADLQHISRIIDQHKPTVVITFGKVAADGVELHQRTTGAEYALLKPPHPAARGSHVGPMLEHANRQLRELVTFVTCPSCSGLSYPGATCYVCSAVLPVEAS